MVNDKLRHNLRVLAKLRLIPRFFGQDMSYCMTQVLPPLFLPLSFLCLPSTQYCVTQAYNGPGCINIMPNLTLTDTFKVL